MWVAYVLLDDLEQVEKLEENLFKEINELPKSLWFWRGLFWKNTGKLELANWCFDHGLKHDYSVHAITKLDLANSTKIEPLQLPQEMEFFDSLHCT